MLFQEHRTESRLMHSLVEEAQVLLGAMPYANTQEALDIFLSFATTVPGGDHHAQTVLFDELLIRLGLAIASRFCEDVTLEVRSRACLIEQLRNRHASATPSLNNWRIRRFFVCVRSRYSDARLTARDVAKELNISSWQLARLLHDETGRPFREHMRAIRIGEAKRLLLTSSLSIKEVSAAVGYRSVSVFDHHFRDDCGHSPSQFRNAS